MPEHLERHPLGKVPVAAHDGMRIRDASKYIAGDEPSPADFFPAPVCFCVTLVQDAARVFDVPGLRGWWDRVQQLDSYRATKPDPG